VNILVLGATGATGKLFVSQALVAGHEVTAYVRDPGQISMQPNLAVVSGQIDDPDALASALVGHDAVVSMLGNGHGKTDKTLIDDSTRVLIRAAEAGGVKRLVIMSAFGVGESLAKSSWQARLVYTRILGAMFADKARGEAQLKSSDLDWTIVYPVTLTDKATNNSSTASRLEVTPHIRGIPKISRSEVAVFLLKSTVNGLFKRQIVVLRPV
jgi:putative NADH-flavin reductase